MIAPARSGRPGAWLPPVELATEEELERCPFCGGREDRTPPEVLRIGDPWRVRVVPNLYPALERQEVVIHSPDHIRSFAELGDEQVALVAEAWEERIDGADGVLVFINEGRLAGASLPHSHSQLAWTTLPGERVGELAALLGEHEIARRGDVVSAAHPVAAGPYECLIAPAEASGELADALVLLRDLVRRLHELEGARAWNAWLHPGPRWHLHFAPRLTALAGIEFGAGLYVNVLPPDVAAERLRG